MSTLAREPLRWYGFRLAPASLASYARELALAGPEQGLEVMARAIGASPGSGILGAAGATVDGAPWLALLARENPATEAALRAQLAGLESACRRLRRVGLGQADRVAAELARRLRRRLGGELGRYRCGAIPRGGWLVAGLLARHLPPWEPGAGAEEDRGLVLVDDCVFTGAALRRFLRRAPARRVVFAPLFAPLDLARRIEETEPQVEAVIVGEALRDRGVELLGAAYDGWRQRWRTRLPDRLHPAVLTDFVCLPWNEPSRLVWNPGAGRPEAGWRLMPGAGEATGSGGGRTVAAQLSPGAVRPRADVVWADAAGRIHVGRLSDGSSWRLDEVASRLWQALMRGGDAETALIEVAALFDADRERILRDLGRWLRELLGRGLLERI